MNPQKLYTQRVMPYKISAITDLEISIIYVTLGYSWYPKNDAASLRILIDIIDGKAFL